MAKTCYLGIFGGPGKAWQPGLAGPGEPGGFLRASRGGRACIMQ